VFVVVVGGGKVGDFKAGSGDGVLLLPRATRAFAV
jgi:hypothetical protein